MACNCATQEQINELYKTYGEKVDAKLSGNWKLKAKNTVRKIGVYICLIPIVPVIVLYVLYKGFGDSNKKISVRKFFKFAEINS